MSDLELGSSLSTEAAALLEAERLHPGPPAAIRARILERVAATVGPGATPGGGGGDGGGTQGWPGAAPAAATGAGTGAGLLLKPGIIVAFVVGVGAGIGGTVAVQSGRPAQPVPSSPRQRPVATPAARAPFAPSASAAATASSASSGTMLAARPASTPSTRPNGNGTHKRVRPVAAPVVETTATAESLAAERRLVEMARTALGRTRPKDALAALAGHRKRFPRGQLAEERDALTVLALIASSEGVEARDEAQKFRDRYPRSLLLPAIEAALDKEKQRGNASE